MTRASDVRKITYQGDGSDTTFTIPFNFFSTNAYINVILIDETDPDEPTFTQQSYTTHYTISGTTLTMLVAPESDQKLFIELVVPFTQLLDLVDGNFPATWQSTLETYLDKYVTMSQKLKDDLARCAHWPLGSSEDGPEFSNAPEEDRLLKWDASGNIVNGPTHEQVEAAEGFATAAAASASSAASSATSAANSAAAAAASAAGVQGGYTVEDSRGTPADVTALGGVVISDNTKHRIKKYVQGSGGAVDISANPQITAGAYDGQELLLVGRSATNTLQLDDGNGLSLQGTCILGLDESINLNWDGSVWVEVSRSN